MSWHSPNLSLMNRGNQIAHTIQLCCQRHKQFPLNSLQVLQLGKMNEFHRNDQGFRYREYMYNAYFIFLGSKITADGDCSSEIKRCLLLGRKVMTNLDSILKSRDITLSTKVCLVKAMVFPVVMYGCESWTIRKAERWRINALNCGIGEDSWESLGLQGDPTSPF